MKVAVMQPYFLPYIGYFQLINAVDVFVIYDDVNYIKRGWINRNNILVNNKSFLFTIPLKEVSQNKKINQIAIVDSEDWKFDFLKTIELAYKKAPFFKEVYFVIKKILFQSENGLVSFITHSLQLVCDYLLIKTKIVLSSAIVKSQDLKGQDKIIQICKKIEATNYINAIGGQELYDKNVFQMNNINLKFIKSNSIVYEQFKNEFVPWLSIIDLMMFNSVSEINNYLNQYQLV